MDVTDGAFLFRIPLYLLLADVYSGTQNQGELKDIFVLEETEEIMGGEMKYV